jgi:integrase
LTYGVDRGVVARNIARDVPNREPTRREPDAFGSWSEVEDIAEKLAPKFRAIPLVVCATALRPEEWRALRWEDVDVQPGELHVRRVLVDGVIRAYGKTDVSIRRVPLGAVPVAALRSMPTPLRSSELVFPGRGGAPIDLHAWRRNHWKPAVIAAGLHTARHMRCAELRSLSGSQPGSHCSRRRNTPARPRRSSRSTIAD